MSSFLLGIDVIKKLMEPGVDMDWAVIRGQTPACIIASEEKQRNPKDELFFEEAANLFSRESIEQINNSGEAAVHLAAKNDHSGMLQKMPAA